MCKKIKIDNRCAKNIRIDNQMLSSIYLYLSTIYLTFIFITIDVLKLEKTNK